MIAFHSPNVKPFIQLNSTNKRETQSFYLLPQPTILCLYQLRLSKGNIFFKKKEKASAQIVGRSAASQKIDDFDHHLQPHAADRSSGTNRSLQTGGRPWWLRQSRVHLQCGRPGLDPWVGKIPWRREGLSTPYFCLENPMDRGAWWAAVRGVAKNRSGGYAFYFCKLPSCAAPKKQRREVCWGPGKHGASTPSPQSLLLPPTTRHTRSRSRQN